MKNLPNDIWIHIYEYDATFHDIYDTMKKEFFLKTPYWRLKWLNRDIRYLKKQKKFNPLKFRSHYNSIYQLTDYWNYKYIKKYWEGESLYNSETEFITDSFGSQGCTFLFENLKMLRHYQYDFENGNLYKPAKKSSKNMRSYYTTSS